MKAGDDPRDIYWRKSTHSNQLVLRERARETQSNVLLSVDSEYPGSAPSADWSERLEQRIRDIASQAVAHLRRGDIVTVQSSSGERARGGLGMGADPLLRFLALLEPRAKQEHDARAAHVVPPVGVPTSTASAAAVAKPSAVKRESRA
jgi:uncharacterized protein (DUF58 family)